MEVVVDDDGCCGLEVVVDDTDGCCWVEVVDVDDNVGWC